MFILFGFSICGLHGKVYYSAEISHCPAIKEASYNQATVRRHGGSKMTNLKLGSVYFRYVLPLRKSHLRHLYVDGAQGWDRLAIYIA